MAVFPLVEDVTGLSPDNYEESNPVQLTSDNSPEYLTGRVVIPQHAPYFLNDNFKVFHVTGPSSEVELIRGVDYIPVMEFRSAAVALQKEIYVGYVITNPNVTGSVRHNANYLGGNWAVTNLTHTVLLERLLRVTQGVRKVYAEQIVGWPTVFPPGPHGGAEADISGIEDLTDSLDALTAAVQARPASVDSSTLIAYDTAIRDLIDGINSRLDAISLSGTDAGSSIAALTARVADIESAYLTRADLDITVEQFEAGRMGGTVIVNPTDIGSVIVVPLPGVLTESTSWIIRRAFNASGTYRLAISTGTILGIAQDGTQIADQAWDVDTTRDLSLTFNRDTVQYILKVI